MHGFSALSHGADELEDSKEPQDSLWQVTLSLKQVSGAAEEQQRQQCVCWPRGEATQLLQS